MERETSMFDDFLARYAYWLTTVLLVIGLYGMGGKRNLVKKLIGMNIFQSAIILFFVAGSVKEGATVPIIEGGLHEAIDVAAYANPLPHVLMLTAIVVSVAITGVALAFLIAMYKQHGTLEEEAILGDMK